MQALHRRPPVKERQIHLLRLMSFHSSKPFVLQGEYAGFIRTLLGKRRMVLRTGEEDFFLKVPKDFRHRLAAALAPGSKISVAGHEVCEDGSRGPKLVVSTVQMVTPSGVAIPIGCPIRVCTKKNCWRSGGKELWDALETQLAERGLTGAIQLEGVDCLDHCKRAPNAEWQGCEFHRCSPADAEKIVDTLQEKQPARTLTESPSS